MSALQVHKNNTGCVVYLLQSTKHRRIGIKTVFFILNRNLQEDREGANIKKNVYLIQTYKEKMANEKNNEIKLMGSPNMTKYFQTFKEIGNINSINIP